MHVPQLEPGSGKHAIGWLDIPSIDDQATQKFYSEVFGWKCESHGEDYTFFSPPKGLMGGFSKPQPDRPFNTLFYIYVPDIDEAMAAIEEAGGKTLMPKTVIVEESGGSIALFRDPAGVMIGLANMVTEHDYSPDAFGGEENPDPNTICSIEIYGGDLKATGEFYNKLFGWSVNEAMPQYLMFNTGAGVSGVFQGHTEQLTVVVYIYVEDVAAAFKAIAEAGGKPIGEPMNAPGMPTFGYFTDPSGNTVGLIGAK